MQSIKPRQFYNVEKMAEISSPFFQSAYQHGLVRNSCSGGPQRRIQITLHGRPAVDYTRCGYLNLDTHPYVLSGAKKCLDNVNSTHYSVARTRLTCEPLNQLEERLSRLFKSESVIAFPTVTAANMACLPLLAAGMFTKGKKPLIVFDRFAHNSLQYHIPVLRTYTEVVIIEHNDLNHLEEICQSNSLVAYIGDGVYSMGGAAPIRELQQLQLRYNLFLYLDDAHGTSIMGQYGEGFIRSQIEQLGDQNIIAGSLGKGFGASGGFIMLGSKIHDEAIRRFSSPYAFSCAPNMAAVGAALASSEIHASAELNKLQNQLQENLKLFDRLFPISNSQSPFPIRILHVGDEAKAIATGKALLDQGYYTSVVFFPTVARGQAGIRLCISAGHTSDDLANLAQTLIKVVGCYERNELSLGNN